MKKNKKTKEYSKKICSLCLVVFITTTILAIVTNFTSMPADIFSYLIPATGTLAAASVGFYFNKAKAENLSKQKLRNVVLKLGLEQRLGEGDYDELIAEIDNIDATVEAKLNSMYEEAVYKESNEEVI